MSFPTKIEFYNNLTMESITNTDYKHVRRVWENVGVQNLGQYYNLHVQSDTLLTTDVLENFRNKYLEIYELDPAHFLSAP